MHSTSKPAILNSALWAAYGDALGFIGEFADPRTLRYRIGADKITQTVPWKRRIGGRFGVTLDLPAGCYSDDTQLRLATARAIRSDGHFDVEAFAKVELPIWRAYSLGGGLSTKAASSSLVRGDVNWFSNFFSEKSASYFNAGGNGPVMRIQPHVWAASNVEDPKTYLKDVIRNTICTHGHPGALAGSVFHAICLAWTIRNSRVPNPAVWRDANSRLTEIPDLIRRDDELNSFWFPVWRQRANTEMDAALRAVQQEGTEYISIIEKASCNQPDSAYSQVLKDLGGFEAATRGSGIRTAFFACALSWFFRDKPAADALIAAANALGSDTDTIATVAGAILGAVQDSAPTGELADREYIRDQALRLWEVSSASARESFQYPDLLVWKPPQSLVDAVGLSNGHLAIAGLGIAEPAGPKSADSRDKTVSWQWLKLKFGQTVLARQRQTLSELSDQNKSQGKALIQTQELKGTAKMNRQPDLFKEPQDGRAARKDIPREEPSIDDLTDAAINSGFDPELIGRHLLELASRKDGVELTVAYAAIIAKAKRARIRAQKKKDEGDTKGN